MIEIKLARPEKNVTFHPWESLNYVIGMTWGHNLTGKIELLVNQDGLQNRNVDMDCKEKFRERVTPWLKECANVTGPLTGRIEAHYAEGKLKKATFHSK